MSASVISHTQSSAGAGAGASDLLAYIAHVARVSNPANENNTATAEKLVRYLIRNGHWSPLEMANICVEIRTTRDIARQILRHRSFSFQEFSQRYAVVGDLDSKPVAREARLQDMKNRQNSLETSDAELAQWWSQQQQAVIELSSATYEEAIKRGIAKEQARAVLPEGNTPTRLYMNGNVRSWWHYIKARTDPGTQKEHREVALACAAAIEPLFSLIKEAIVGGK